MYQPLVKRNLHIIVISLLIAISIIYPSFSSWTPEIELTLLHSGEYSRLPCIKADARLEKDITLFAQAQARAMQKYHFTMLAAEHVNINRCIITAVWDYQPVLYNDIAIVFNPVIEPEQATTIITEEHSIFCEKQVRRRRWDKIILSGESIEGVPFQKQITNTSLAIQFQHAVEILSGKFVCQDI